LEILACLKIAVDDIQVVKIPDALEQITHEKGYFLLPEASLYGFSLFNQFLESSSSNQLHLDQEMLISLVKGVKFDDIFMIHGFKDLCFFEERPDS
jgi:hypothetical protein